MYLEKAKQLINDEYNTKYILAKTEHARVFMDEKIKHSYQVLGAGNFLLRHEKYFAKYNKEEISYYQSIALLHDVYRFQEALELEKKHKVDHGVCGAEYLSQIKFYNKKDALLAIKHHGHLIERLYEDEAYQKLSKKEQKHIQQVTFFVRDADKLANLYLLATHLDDIRPVFFSEKTYQNPHDKNVLPSIMADFMGHKCVNRGDVRNFADHALMIISWTYDINYESSFIFLEKLHIFEKLFDLFAEYWRPEDRKNFQKTIQEFIKIRTSS